MPKTAAELNWTHSTVHWTDTAQPECMTASPVRGCETSVQQKQQNALMPGTFDEWCSTGKVYKLVDITTGEVVMQGKPAAWIGMQQAV